MRCADRSLERQQKSTFNNTVLLALTPANPKKRPCTPPPPMRRLEKKKNNTIWSPSVLEPLESWRCGASIEKMFPSTSGIFLWVRKSIRDILTSQKSAKKSGLHDVCGCKQPVSFSKTGCETHTLQKSLLVSREIRQFSLVLGCKRF